MTQAALRRAWSADPDIRDFVGLADYAWDYHTPGSMPGFGPLEMTDDLRRVVARILGDVSTEKDNTGHVDPRPEAPSEQIAESSIARAGAEIIPQPACDKLSQVVAGNGIILNKVERREDNTSIDPIVRRTHGGALPK